MNLSKLTDINSLRSALSRVSYGDRLRPQRDWLAVITITGILLLASGGWSYWLFEQVAMNEQQGTDAVATHINTSALDTVDRVFAARAAERAHYQDDYRFVDPSH